MTSVKEMSQGGVVTYCNGRINWLKKKGMSPKRKGIETQTSRIPSGMSS